MKKVFTVLCSMVILLLVLGAPLYLTDKAAADSPVFGDVVFNFETVNATMGWGVAWGSSFDPSMVPVEWSGDIDVNGNQGSLKVNLKYNNGGWEEANISTWISGTENTKYDLSGYDKIEYDLYIPNPSTFDGTLQIGMALNNDWSDISGLLGFQQYNISKMDATQIHGKSFVILHISQDISTIARANSGQLVLRLCGTGSHYQGCIYVDNIIIKAISKNIVYDFSNGTAMGWDQAWGTNYVGNPPVAGCYLDIATTQGALRVNVKYTNGTWDDAEIGVNLASSGKRDLSSYERVSYDLYIPNPQSFP